MEIARTPPTWFGLLRRHAGDHPLIATGLGIALVTMLGLLLQSLTLIWSGEADAAVVCAARRSGGFRHHHPRRPAGLMLRRIPQRVEDSLLGLAAGMMLAASAFSLLLPGLEAGTQITDNKGLGAAVVVFGMAIGVMLMLGLDEFTPHEHDKTGPCGPGHERCGRVWLFVFAIALHNLPEGMAIGVSFAEADLSVGLPLTTAIALQDIPEGLAVALALRGAGFGALPSVLIAAGSGMLEPLGALLGWGSPADWPSRIRSVSASPPAR